MTPADKYLNTQEAADLLGVNKRTLMTLVNRKLIPVIRLSARTLRFDRNAIARALNGLTVQAG
jgi:excisionase family DNA binding protein